MSPARIVANPLPSAPNQEPFSLVLGGPLYQLLIKARLLRPPSQLLYRRMLVITGLAWLPLLALTLLEGDALAGSQLPFLHDIEAYARFLIAIPLLVLAEPIVHSWTREIIQQFGERGVVPPISMPGFQAAIDSATRWRNSLAVEIALMASVFVLAPFMWQHMTLYADTWYATADSGDIILSRAGWWLVHISVPIFQFLLLRWWYRMAIWWRFLWQVSRLALDIRAAHPDRSGGLGFLGDGVYGFMPFLFAQGAVVSGLIASRVLTGAHTAVEFRGEVVLLIMLLVAQVLVPILFFTPGLIASKRDGLRRYGALAAAHGREFEDKWIGIGTTAGERLLGNPDISSLADMSACHDVVRSMRPVAFDLRVLLQLTAISAAPFLPLVLTVIPVAELLQRVVRMVL